MVHPLLKGNTVGIHASNRPMNALAYDFDVLESPASRKPHLLEAKDASLACATFVRHPDGCASATLLA
jgi:hypothetical protein